MFNSKFLKSLKDKLFKGFVIYLSSSVINKAIPFLLLPILTRYLTTEEYGILAIYQVMISFGDNIIGLRTKSIISRNFFKRSKEYVARIVFNMVFLLWLSSTLFLILISLYIGLGGGAFNIPARWLYALPIFAFMNMINGFNLAILRNRRRSIEFGGFEIIKTVIDLSVSILLIVVFAYGWEGRAAGILIGTSIVGIISLYRMWQTGYVAIKIDIKQIKEILSISLPLIFHGVGSTVILASDRIFIDRMVNTSAVGIYTVAYQFGMIVSLIVNAFNRSWSTWVYEMLAKENKNSKNQIVKASYLVAVGYLLVALAVTGGSYYLLPFMTAEEYHGGIIYIGWIAMGYALWGMYTLVFPYGVHKGSTSHLGVTTFLAATVNIVGNYLLINMNGVIGAAQSTLFSYLVMFLSVWWYSNRIYPMPWINALFSKNENQLK